MRRKPFSGAQAILWTALAGLLLAGPLPLRAQIPGLMNSTLSIPGGVQTFSIAVGPDGNIWLTDFTGNKIGRLTPAGVYTAFSVPTANAGPRFITNGPDGNLWFTEFNLRQIGRITPAGVIAEFAVPGSSIPTTLDAIVAGPDGNIWFADGAFTQNTQVGRIAPDGTGVTEFPIGGSMVNGQIAAGPDGNVWFSDHGESTVNRIGKITTDGVVTVYMLPSPGIPLP
ncbi:MAG TPA: Virginiamycin B lyase, partial [Thermoanaerobaculia bacterium]